MGVAYSSLKYEVLSQLDLTINKFVYNTMRARGHENHVSTIFCMGVELVRDAVCFFAKSY